MSTPCQMRFPENRPKEIPISLKGVSLERGKFSLLVPSLEVPPGEKVAVLGENGSGKTTLLAIMAGFLTPHRGEVMLGDLPISALSPMERARLVAFLPQLTSVVFPFTVYQLVLMGRFPHCDRRDFGVQDHSHTEKILKAMNLQDLRHRKYPYLSGGEQRRVMLAKVLNQSTPLLLLDEPVAMLDTRHALLSLNLLKSWRGTVVAVMHDVNLALAHFERFLFLKEGCVLYDIEKEAISHEILSEVYGVSARRCWAFGFTLQG